jgi:hypothetical protein
VATRQAGLYGRPLVRTDLGDLVAWASELDAPPDQFTRDDLLEHHAIISQLHARLDACLPARFPTWLTDDGAEIRKRAAELNIALERVRDRSELAITAVWTSPPDDPPPGEPKTGTQYLRARQHAFAASDQRRARAQALADEIERTAGHELIEATRKVCPSPAVALSAALLVPRAAAEGLKARFAREQPDVRILVNGPWPPYTFAVTVMEA